LVELEVNEAVALPVFTKEFERVFSNGTVTTSYKQASYLLNNKHEYKALISPTAIFGPLDTTENLSVYRAKDYRVNPYLSAAVNAPGVILA
jgi:hypothetical protein